MRRARKQKKGVADNKAGTRYLAMATSEVLTQSEKGALDQVLRPHLRLEPATEKEKRSEWGMLSASGSYL